MPAGNRRLAQWRVTWLIEHSTSHQLLWCIDSFVLQNPPLRQAPNRCKQCFSRTSAEGFFKILSVFFLNILSKSFVDNCSFKILKNSYCLNFKSTIR